MGVTLDAAYSHGVSVGNRARPQRAQAGPPLREAPGRGCHAVRGPQCYLLLVNTGVAGALVSQPFKRPSSPPVWNEKHLLTVAPSQQVAASRGENLHL